jgi:hypothetical protein
MAWRIWLRRGVDQRKGGEPIQAEGNSPGSIDGVMEGSDTAEFRRGASRNGILRWPSSWRQEACRDGRSPLSQARQRHLYDGEVELHLLRQLPPL